MDALPLIRPSWLTASGDLDPEALFNAFLTFWRQHAEAQLGDAPYHEIAPHLVLMAFLQRVVNGGGTLEREYAIGRGRMDLCLRYRRLTLAIELKVWRPGAPDPLAEGLQQLDRYLAGLGLESGWLVIFDRRLEAQPLSERLTNQTTQTSAGRAVRLVRA